MLWLRIWALTTFVLEAALLVFVAIWQYLAPPDAPTPAAFWVILALFGTIFGALRVAAAFAPYKPWGWTAGLLALSFGLVSCTFPLAIVLLVYWRRPITKATFGRI